MLFSTTPKWTGDRSGIRDSEKWARNHQDTINEHIDVCFLADKWFMPKLCEYAIDRLGSVLQEQKALSLDWDEDTCLTTVACSPAAVRVTEIMAHAMVRIFEQPMATGPELRNRITRLFLNSKHFGKRSI